MNINIVILVVAVWGGRLLRDFVEETCYHRDKVLSLLGQK